MNITQHIRIWRKDVEKIKTLDCIESIDFPSHSQTAVTVVIAKDKTLGRNIAHEGDHLVQFANGLWQRFGAEAFNRLSFNP